MKSDHPDTGLLTYFLPMKGGATKGWSTETEDFFCCHGTLVQANAAHNRGIYYQSEKGISVCQYISSEAVCIFNNIDVSIEQTIDTLSGSHHDSSTSAGLQATTAVTSKYQSRPEMMAIRFKVICQPGSIHYKHKNTMVDKDCWNSYYQWREAGY